MRHMRPILPALTLYLATFLACVALVAVPSGCGASQRSKTVSSLLTVTNAARDGFVAWDLEHQTAIVQEVERAGGTREDVEKKIAAYREKRGAVIDGFIAVYQLIAAASMVSDDPSLMKAIGATNQLLKTIEILKDGG